MTKKPIRLWGPYTTTADPNEFVVQVRNTIKEVKSMTDRGKQVGKCVYFTKDTSKEDLVKLLDEAVVFVQEYCFER